VPYPGDDDDDDSSTSTFFTPGPSNPSPPDTPACPNCTVHTGFYTSWLHTRPLILEHLVPLLSTYPTHTLVLVGHSLGGAVATLAGLDFLGRGWHPIVTTFGEPRLGNYPFTQYVDARFNLSRNHDTNRLRRVTHKGDPVPLLPLEEWGYDMHGDEVFIGKEELPVGIADVRYCEGDRDEACIAGSDGHKGSWGVPARFKFWQLWFAHRDYFWRLGLCLPGVSGEVGEWYGKVVEDEEYGQEREVEEL
jgi:pimeloyl-ACP methyl ester carboxylesterase